MNIVVISIITTNILHETTYDMDHTLLYSYIFFTEWKSWNMDLAWNHQEQLLEFRAFQPRQLTNFEVLKLTILELNSKMP